MSLFYLEPLAHDSGLIFASSFFSSHFVFLTSSISPIGAVLAPFVVRVLKLFISSAQPGLIVLAFPFDGARQSFNFSNIACVAPPPVVRLICFPFCCFAFHMFRRYRRRIKGAFFISLLSPKGVKYANAFCRGFQILLLWADLCYGEFRYGHKPSKWTYTHTYTPT